MAYLLIYIIYIKLKEEQLRNISKMPFLKSHIACMPDVHWGHGATVGSVIATKGAVGVDLGCGMCAVKLSLKAHQLPDNLKQIRNKIEQLVPHGRTSNGAKGDKGAWKRLPISSKDLGTMTVFARALMVLAVLCLVVRPRKQYLSMTTKKQWQELKLDWTRTC